MDQKGIDLYSYEYFNSITARFLSLIGLDGIAAYLINRRVEIKVFRYTENMRKIS